MSRKLIFLTYLISTICYGQITFIIKNSEDVYSKLTDILKEQKVFPSDIETKDIHITDLINKNNKVDTNLNSGFYNIYYHYHWNSILLFKNKNSFTLYKNPLRNFKLIFEQAIVMNKTKKESKKYIKRIYDHLSDTLERKHHPKLNFIAFSNLDELKKIKTQKKKKERNEQKELKRSYKYYLNSLCI